MPQKTIDWVSEFQGQNSTQGANEQGDSVIVSKFTAFSTSPNLLLAAKAPKILQKGTA